MDSQLYKRCRDARRADQFSSELMAELMDACGRHALASTWRQPDAPATVPMRLTGLEYFIREAQRHQAKLGELRTCA